MPREINRESVFITETALNQRGTAEGSLLPPRQRGEFRVPFVTGLRVEKRSTFLGGTQFVISWQEPEGLTSISHYNVYVLGLLDNNKSPMGPATFQKSPGILRLVSDGVVRVTFVVQTVMKNGMVSELDASPAVSSETLASTLASTDLNGIGTTGELLTWSAGTATLISPGALNTILAGNGTALPSYKTRTTLDLVEGRGNLTTASRLVLVSASGVVTQLGSLGTTTTVLHGNAAGAPSFGAVSLTADVTGVLPVANGGTAQSAWNAGRVVFVGAGGTSLTEDADLSFATANDTLTAKRLLTPSATAPTPLDGHLWNDSAIKTYKMYTNGVEKTITTQTYTSTADGLVEDTVTETTLIGTGLGTLTLPANFFVAGKTVRLWAYGVYSTDAVAADLQLRIKLGSTVIGDTGVQTPANGITDRYWTMRGVITCRTTGATGTVMAQATFEHLATSVSTGTLTWWEMSNTAATVIDTTAAQILDFTAEWSAADVDNSIQCTNFTVEVI